MATYKDIAATTEGRVGIVEIRKPPHNFFDVALINQIADAFEAFDADPEIRSVLFCAEGGGCESVNSSIYSEINGIPIAILGLGAYLAIAALLTLEKRVGALETYGPLAVFGLALTGTLYSAYLTYVELFVLRAVCPYCVASAVLITAIFILAVVRFWRAPPE